MTVKIFTVAEVPEELSQAWLQHLRAFDAAHPGCHFQVAADAPDMPMAKIIEMLQINPGLDFQAVFERPKDKGPTTAQAMAHELFAHECFAFVGEGPRPHSQRCQYAALLLEQWQRE